MNCRFSEGNYFRGCRVVVYFFHNSTLAQMSVGRGKTSVCDGSLIISFSISSTSTVSPLSLLPHHCFIFVVSVRVAMDDVELRTVRRTFTAHGTTDIDVVYTNNITHVEDTLEELKPKLWKMEEGEEFMGLDFEYTNDPDKEKKVSCVQLRMDRTVLVWQLARYDTYIFLQ